MSAHAGASETAGLAAAPAARLLHAETGMFAARAAAHRAAFASAVTTAEASMKSAGAHPAEFAVMKISPIRAVAVGPFMMPVESVPASLCFGTSRMMRDEADKDQQQNERVEGEAEIGQ